jgi:nitrogenase-associated protein
LLDQNLSRPKKSKKRTFANARASHCGLHGAVDLTAYDLPSFLPTARDSAMKKVVFYQKSGSKKDREHKDLLAAAGYEVETRDLTAENWTSAGLRAFFAERPVPEWFDPAAPQVLSGEIDPSRANPQQALVMLSVNPSLINGPLIKCNGRCASGLDVKELRQFLEAHACGGKPASVKHLPSTWSQTMSA